MATLFAGANLFVAGEERRITMIEGGYEYGETFQHKLLALLVRHPKRANGRIKAQYFTFPIQVDIARVVQETYSKHPKDRLTRNTLCELVKASLGSLWHRLIDVGDIG